MRFVLAALALLAATPALACMPLAPQMEGLIASGLPFEEVEGDTLGGLIEQLRENVSFALPPSKLVIAFNGPQAKVAVIIGDALCGVFIAPSDGIRTMLSKARGDEEL